MRHGRDDVYNWFRDKLIIKANDYDSETTVEKAVYKQLENFVKIENIKRQYNLSGNFRPIIDIDLYNGKIGIEIKCAKSLNKNQNEFLRTIGQICFYSKRQYKRNLLLLIVGTETERTSTITELMEIVESHKSGIRAFYKTVKD